KLAGGEGLHRLGFLFGCLVFVRFLVVGFLGRSAVVEDFVVRGGTRLVVFHALLRRARRGRDGGSADLVGRRSERSGLERRHRGRAEQRYAGDDAGTRRR